MRPVAVFLFLSTENFIILLVPLARVYHCRARPLDTFSMDDTTLPTAR